MGNNKYRHKDTERTAVKANWMTYIILQISKISLILINISWRRIENIVYVMRTIAIWAY